MIVSRSLFFLGLFALCVGLLQAGEDSWQESLREAVKTSVTPAESLQTAYISSARDRSSQDAYYPFLRNVRGVIESGLLEQEFRLATDPLSADFFVYPEYEVSRDGLSLSIEIKSASNGSVIAKQLVTLKNKTLPAGWDKRSLEDVAYELVMKLERAIYPGQVNFLNDQISVTNEAQLVSEFSTTIKAYLGRELRRRSSAFRPVSQAQSEENTFGVVGQYQELGSDVVLTLSLVDPKTDSIRATAEAILSAQDVPAELRLTPSNASVALESIEPDHSVVPEGLSNVLSLWVNNDPPRYRDGDPLVVSVRAAKDLYLRVYYIQSDGLICQIFPSGKGGVGFLRANRTFEVGGLQDAVELIISDETKGQETIKAFASLGPIDDSGIPKQFIASANMSCMTQGYRSLQSGITRALKMQHKVRPVAETKILVTDSPLSITES